MTGPLKKPWMVIAAAIVCCLSLTAHAGMLQDGGFEVDAASTPWGLFGNATIETTPTTLVADTQALKLDGNDTALHMFTVGWQFIALGTDYKVGDKILLEGLIGHLSSDPLSGTNIAYIEIAFANSTAPDNSGVDFSNVFQSVFLDASSATDTYFSVATSVATIPEKVFGLDTQYIRIAASLHQNIPTDPGAAWFDNLALGTVPEPGIIALLTIGLLGLGFARRNKAGDC